MLARRSIHAHACAVAAAWWPFTRTPDVPVLRGGGADGGDSCPAFIYGAAQPLSRTDQSRYETYLAHERKYGLARLAVSSARARELVARMSALVDYAVGVEPAAPERHGDWAYYARRSPDGQVVYYRRRVSGEALHGPERVVLDVAEVLRRTPRARTASVGVLKIAPTHQALLAYTLSEEVSASERRDAYVVRLEDGAVLARLNDVVNMEWAADDTTLFYTRAARHDSLVPNEIWRHRLGVAGDVCVYREADAAFAVDVGRTKDHRYMTLNAHAASTSEVWLLDARDSADIPSPRCVQARREGVRYFVDSQGAAGLVLTAHGPAGAGSRILRAADGAPIVPSSDEHSIEDVDVLAQGVLAYGRHTRSGLPSVRLARPGEPVACVAVPPDAGPGASIAFELSACANADSTSDSVRMLYSDLLTPPRLCVLPLRASPASLRPLTAARRPATSAGFRIARVSVGPAGVPLTLLQPPAGARKPPALLLSYGAYGACTYVGYQPNLLALAERGWLVAIAHVRGGGERGHAWHEAGMGGAGKARGVQDLLACAHYLACDSGQVDPARLTGYAASAGGALLAAAIHTEPSLFAAAVLQAPFVYVSASLAAGDALSAYDSTEWGTGFCPSATLPPPGTSLFPRLLVCGSPHDARVPLAMLVRYVAELRSRLADRGAGRVILHVDEEAGHFGPVGSDAALGVSARQYAFLCESVDRVTACSRGS